MTPAEFKKLPPLLDRADLLGIGWSDKYLCMVRVEVKNEKTPIPFGRVGWVRNVSNGDGANGTNHRGKWRKSDVARILGPEWQ